MVTKKEGVNPPFLQKPHPYTLPYYAAVCVAFAFTNPASTSTISE